MAWKKVGSMKGPKGDQGDQGPAASTSDVFKQAHPVGSYMDTNGVNPGTVAGTWTKVPTVGVDRYRRTS